jgi:hypothetical protein
MKPKRELSYRLTKKPSEKRLKRADNIKKQANRIWDEYTTKNKEIRDKFATSIQEVQKTCEHLRWYYEGGFEGMRFYECADCGARLTTDWFRKITNCSGD